ncbi:MAG: hypothetical protein JW807_09285 [Spirochaetes bacterium]|nr:hypothetical protein [Spirochaetota bacterium]
MKRIFTTAAGIAAVCIFMLMAQVNLNGADIGIGASVRYSWWGPYWSQASDTRILPEIKLKSDFSGGAVVRVGINETWSLFSSYTYGIFTGTASSFLLNPLYYYIEQPVNTKREARRHDFNFFLSGRLNRHVRLFGGVVYTGYSMYTEAGVIFFRYSYRIFHHFAGPSIGLDFSIPLVSTLYLLPSCSAVFQFSRFSTLEDDAISDFINKTFGGTDTTLLYAGLNVNLSLAYHIRQINLSLALGGYFHYLWIRDIDGGSFVADKRHDMFGGIQLAAVYTIRITALTEKSAESRGRNLP